MPVHDWSRVDEGVFHDFYLSWYTHLSAELNLNVLRRGHYSMVERKFDFDSAEEPDAPYHRLDRRLVIRSETDHRMAALVEVVSPHHKNSPDRLDLFCRMCASAVRDGISASVIDLFRPQRFDPAGIHAEISRRHSGEAVLSPEVHHGIVATYHTTNDKPYVYTQSVSMSEELADIPVFVDREQYVSAPLESTYMAAFRGIAAYWRNVIDPE